MPQAGNVGLVDIDQQMMDRPAPQFLSDRFRVTPRHASASHGCAARFGFSRSKPPGSRQAPFGRIAELQDDAIVSLREAFQHRQRVGFVQIAEHDEQRPFPQLRGQLRDARRHACRFIDIVLP